MTTFKNETGATVEVEIPVEYDGAGNVVRTKTHELEPGEVIVFDGSQDNGEDVRNECIAKALSQL